MADYSYRDLLNTLKNVGVKKGDSLFLHSNLGYFGRAENCHNAEELCEFFFRAINEAVGNMGTIIVPTFTYSFCHGELFDVNETSCKCGIFPEYIRRRAGAMRSLDPNFSVTAYGYKKIYYTENATHESFGKGSFWERFLRENGKILCLNFDSGSTFVHFAERQNNVEYRYNKSFNGVIKQNGRYIHDYAVHYVYDLEKQEDAPDFKRLDILCKEHGICFQSTLGKGTIKLMESGAYYNLISDYLKKEPYFLTERGKRI